MAQGATGRIAGAARGRANVVPTRTQCEVETTGDLMPPAEALNPARRSLSGFADARSAVPGGKPPRNLPSAGPGGKPPRNLPSVGPGGRPPGTPRDGAASAR